jgi:hypothetical protein
LKAEPDRLLKNIGAPSASGAKPRRDNFGVCSFLIMAQRFSPLHGEQAAVMPSTVFGPMNASLNSYDNDERYS